MIVRESVVRYGPSVSAPLVGVEDLVLAIVTGVAVSAQDKYTLKLPNGSYRSSSALPCVFLDYFRLSVGIGTEGIERNGRVGLYLSRD